MRTNLEPAELVARLEKLERRNRWMMRGLACLVVLAGTVVLVAADSAPSFQKVIETEQIVVRDQNGKKRIFLGTNELKQAVLYLMDDGERHALVARTYEKDGAAIEINQGGQNRMVWSTGGESQFGGLLFFAKPGKQKEGQIGLYYADDGKPGLYFNDHRNQTRAAIVLEADGPVISLQDEQGKPFFLQGKP